jgi:hypothetical protein
VDNSEAAAWAGNEEMFPRNSVEGLLEEQLVLRDRIMGLEAQLAELGMGAHRTPSELLSAEQRIIAMQSSMAWRVGSALTDPRRVLRRVFRR